MRRSQRRLPRLLRADHGLGRTLRMALICALLLGLVIIRAPLCPFAIVTRHPCPGCGLTRATLALAQGHIHEALHFHPLVMIVSPLVILGFGYNAYGYIRQGRWSAAESLQGLWITRFAIVLGVAMVGVWLARFLGAFGGPVPV